MTAPLIPPPPGASGDPKQINAFVALCESQGIAIDGAKAMLSSAWACMEAIAQMLRHRDETEGLIPYTEFCTLYGMSKNRLRSLVDQGTLEAVRDGGKNKTRL